MTPERSDALIASADRLVPDAQGFGRDVIRRAIAGGLISPDVPAETVARKARSFGQALTLVIKNADMLASIRKVLSVGTVVPFMMGDEQTFQASIRREARGVLADQAESIGLDLEGTLAADWHEVIEATCDAVFGAARTTAAKAA
ncbi:MAG: hypothetical protein AAGG07_06525 [Planctomycetota bacterium]